MRISYKKPPLITVWLEVRSKIPTRSASVFGVDTRLQSKLFAQGSSRGCLSERRDRTRVRGAVALVDKALAGKSFDIDDGGPLGEVAKKFHVSKQALDIEFSTQSVIGGSYGFRLL
jgi:hypothetical protein